MNEQVQYLVSGVLDTLSLISLALMLIGVGQRLRIARRLHRTGGSILMLQVVFYMSLCDAWNYVLSAPMDLFAGLQWKGPWEPHDGEGPTTERAKLLCIAIGTLSQFLSVGSFLWSLWLAMILLLLLLQTSSADISRYYPVMHLGVWFTAFGCTAVPLAYAQYAFIPDDHQCWIKDSHFRLFFYVPCLVVMCVSLGALVAVVMRWGALCLLRRTSLRPVACWVLLFTITWTPPAARRIMELTAPDVTVPEWVAVLHRLGSGIYGTLNFIVWRTLLFSPSKHGHRQQGEGHTDGEEEEGVLSFGARKALRTAQAKAPQHDGAAYASLRGSPPRKVLKCSSKERLLGGSENTTLDPSSRPSCWSRICPFSKSSSSSQQDGQMPRTPTTPRRVNQRRASSRNDSNNASKRQKKNISFLLHEEDHEKECKRNEKRQQRMGGFLSSDEEPVDTRIVTFTAVREPSNDEKGLYTPQARSSRPRIISISKSPPRTHTEYPDQNDPNREFKAEERWNDGDSEDLEERGDSERSDLYVGRGPRSPGHRARAAGYYGYGSDTVESESSRNNHLSEAEDGNIQEGFESSQSRRKGTGADT